MNKTRQPANVRIVNGTLRFICYLALVGVVFMVIPAFPALTAGLASLSIVIFGCAFFAIGLGYLASDRSLKKTVSLTLVAVGAAAIIPAASLQRSASLHGAELKFDVSQYLNFSGGSKSPAQIIRYKQTPQGPLHIAIYRPAGKTSGNTVVMLHGGGWRYGNFTQLGLWPEQLTEKGHVVVSVQYRLSTDTYNSWNDTPSDVTDAINFVRSNGTKMNIPTSSISLMGQSAGGHLALLEAYRNNNVDAIVALYAPTDLIVDYTTSRDKSAELDFIGGTPEEYPDRYRLLSPSTYVSSQSPRTLLIQGTTDDLVSPVNTNNLSTLLQNHGVEVFAVILPFSGHSFDNQRGGLATQISTQKILEFIN